jgi:hypothetical protein
MSYNKVILSTTEAAYVSQTHSLTHQEEEDGGRDGETDNSNKMETDNGNADETPPLLLTRLVKRMSTTFSNPLVPL